MKKPDFKTLALLGVSTGIILTPSLHAQQEKSPPSAKEETKKSDSSKNDPNDENMNYHLMTEDELMMELNSDGIAMYKKLDKEGKGLALLVASASCNNTNPCAHLNACKTDKNDCAGKGECKGKGICAVGDKNLAVRLVYDKMAAKRSQANDPKK